jgi:amino acid transporter
MNRRLSLPLLVSTIFFAVSGGPYGLEPVMASGLGLGLLLILLTPIVWAIPSAMMTAELTAAIPNEGGYYEWVKQALGPFAGFLCATWSWMYSWVDAAIYPVLFAEYVESLFKLSGFEPAGGMNVWMKWGIGLAAIIPFTYLNLKGAVPVGKFARIMAVGLLLPFVILVAVGLPKWLQDPMAFVTPFVPTGTSVSQGFSTGLFVVMWNYLGWDNVSTIAEEVENPRATFPRALAWSMPIITLAYLLPAAIGAVYLRDPAAWEEGVWTEIGRRAAGPWLGYLFVLGGVLSSLGMFSAMLLTASRLPFVMARDRYLPAAFARLHPRFGTPYVAILASAAVYSVLSFSSFTDLAIVDVVLYSAALALEFAALIVFRIREPERSRPYRIPGGNVGLALVSVLPIAVVIFGMINQVQESAGEGKGAQVVQWSLAALALAPIAYGVRHLLSRR